MSQTERMLDPRLSRLRDIIRDIGAVAVAFSGGSDSTLLLAMCRDILGPERVLAITTNSPTLPAIELDESRIIAVHLGVRHEIVEVNELENPDFVRNDTQRCFFCHQKRLKEIEQRAHSCGFYSIVFGMHADDHPDERPGIMAALQHGVRMPLREAGLSKSDIRELARQRGLPTHDKPAMACLASRIPFGKPITHDLLDQIEGAEMFLRNELGLRQVRVRHHDPIARIEVAYDDLPFLVQPGVREQIVTRLRTIGFRYITLDLDGFRSGSMHEAKEQA